MLLLKFSVNNLFYKPHCYTKLLITIKIAGIHEEYDQNVKLLGKAVLYVISSATFHQHSQ